MSTILRRAAAAVLLCLSAKACFSGDESRDAVHSYVSTDQELALLVGVGRYHFGPQLLAENEEVLATGEKFAAVQGCYHLGFVVFAKPSQSPKSCGSFVVRRVEDRRLKQLQQQAQHPPAFEVYETSCKRDAERCPGQKWNGPTVRYYVNSDDELLAFELYPTDSNRQVFVRTSESTVQL